MIYEEKTTKSDKLYEGKIINLRIDTVEIPGKRYSKREIIEHPGSVGIVPIINGDSLVLVKQYRKAVEDFLLEIPAGKLEINEEPRETGLRELAEETGYSANSFKYLIDFYPSPGFSDEKITLFLADDLYEVDEKLDNGEYIAKEIIKIDELIKLVDKGDIQDSKTIIGINLAKKYIDNK